MITEDYVSFETAKLLKDKGFNETSNTIGTYDLNGSFYLYKHEKGYNHNHLHTWYSAPTLQMAMKWLREVHSLFPVVEPFLTEETKPKYWVYVIWHNSIPKYMQSKLNYYTPEEACEAAIKYCLENLI